MINSVADVNNRGSQFRKYQFGKFFHRVAIATADSSLSIFIETAGVYLIGFCDETNVIFSSINLLDIFESFNKSWTEIVFVDWTAPAVGSLTPCEETTKTEEIAI